MDRDDLLRRFTYHAPDANAKEVHQAVREMCLVTANNLNVFLPEGREKSLAITHLEETMMWANAAIARNASEAQ